MKPSLLVILAACGCSDPPAKPDAAIDAPIIDARSIDAGHCGADIAFTGEELDWDSTDAAFCGVFNAAFKVRGSTAPTEADTTSPNGRFVMCIPTLATTTIDIAPPTGANPCATHPGSYALAGIAAVNKQVEAMLPAADVFRVRAFSTTRQTSFYTQIGAAYDPAKGGLMVHVSGVQHAVTISATHDTAQAFDGSVWAAGATGVDVYFPNVPVGVATIIGAAGTIGNGPVPIEANTITYATTYSPT